MKYLLTILLCYSLNYTFGQDSIVLKNYKALKSIIQKSFSRTEESYKNALSEYFIIDIKLDNKTDTIISIDFFRKAASVHYPMMATAVDKIREAWKPDKLGLNRLLIPVLIGFNHDSEFDYPIPLGKSTKDKVYVGELVVIPVFGDSH